MAGVLGIKTYYPENNTPYHEFKEKFRRIFRSNYLDEDNFDPGIHALRAYDSIRTIAEAIKRVSGNTITSNINPQMLLESILSSNFTGLSGGIHFEGGELSDDPIYRIVNVVGKRSYREVDYWKPGCGFLKSLEDDGGNRNCTQGLVGGIIWPGDIKHRIPKGWAMPSKAKPMKIGVPGRTSFEKFVHVSEDNKTDGFCIRLFYELLEIIKDQEQYDLPYEFHSFLGSYDELVNGVSDKTYDAVVGDITILASRWKHVEFTQPYAESGLTMIVHQAKARESAWMFLRPFTGKMWAVTGAILIYTMFVVWFLELKCNPEFEGPFNHQLSTAIWFTFSSLFFAHKEKIYSNFTRVVIVVWLFVALILTSSYTACLSSMLTVEGLKPNVTDIESIKRNNIKIGCDGDSFVRKYLEDVLHFKRENILNVSSEYIYPEEFENGSIGAAFLELPYEKVFVGNHCNKYTATIPTYKFGGLGFVFQKGSPITSDFSKAILKLSENGKLKELEETWFSPSPKCSTNVTSNNTQSLSLESFWGLYLISGSISTICLLLFLARSLWNYKHLQKANEGNVTPTPTEMSVWNNAVRFATFWYKGEIMRPRTVPTVAVEQSSSQSISDNPEHLQANSHREIQMI